MEVDDIPEDGIANGLNIKMRPLNISYQDFEFPYIDVREVLNFGKAVFTYHIKSKGVANKLVMQVIKKELSLDDEVGEVDPEGVLGLEHGIFVKVNDTILQDSMDGFFDHVSQRISKVVQNG